MKTTPPNRFKVMRLIARMNVGGPAIQTSLLTEKLDPQRFESLLVTGVEAEGEGNMLELMGSAVQPLIVPSLGREISLRSDFRTLRAVLRLMQRHRPHIVHTHTAKAGFIGRLAARLARVPIVVHTFHGNVFKGYFSPAKTRLFIALERWLARGTDRIIVLSEQQKQEILSLGIGRPEQFQIVPLGLDLSRFARELPPLFWGRGSVDPFFSPELIARGDAWLPQHTSLTRAVYPGLGHSVSDEMLADVDRFLRAQL